VPSTTIAKLGRIANLGLFQNCPGAHHPSFRQFNLIYGFNGSGKTTLGRIIASLGTGTRCSALPADGIFEVHLSDGTVQSSVADLSALRGRVHVFNTDFLEDSFLWKQGEARPVFYIGREQAELLQTLNQTTANIASKTESLARANQRMETDERAFTVLKRNMARNIADQLGLGRKYDASNLVADYSVRLEKGFCPLAEGEIARLKTVLSQDAPLPQLGTLRLPQTNPADIADRSYDLAFATPGQMTVKGLHGHDSMRQWVGTGLIYHKEHKLEECLFCGSALERERLDILETVIDDNFSRLTDNLTSTHGDLQALATEYNEISRTLPRSGDFDSSIRGRASACINDMRDNFSRVGQLLTKLLGVISDKKALPHKMPADLRPDVIVQLKLSCENAAGTIDKLNSLVDDHNGVIERFQETKTAASSALKSHLLAEGESNFIEAQTALNEGKAEARNIESELAQLRESEESLKRAVRSHGPAADVITRMIHNYLGRKDLELVAADEGYRLRRNGKLVKGSLSEGEKTAIGICYFLTTLEAEGRKRKDLIVVVDDPVSSLDTRALNYSFNVIQAVVKDAAQAFLITHNLQFMREAKMWLHPRTEKGLKQRDKDPSKASATLMFLDTIQPGGPETRNCVLKELPKHIRDYESEYHYMLYLIFQFIASPGDTQHFYLIPNALRKTLDVFLAFKSPGPEGLHSKMEKLAMALEGMDPARIRALERLAQVESHADTLDELVNFSAATVEEVHQASETLLELMGNLDADHLACMRTLCA
jgi:wobble nucleotide-excising tRNase